MNCSYNFSLPTRRAGILARRICAGLEAPPTGSGFVGSNELDFYNRNASFPLSFPLYQFIFNPPDIKGEDITNQDLTLKDFSILLHLIVSEKGQLC